MMGSVMYGGPPYDNQAQRGGGSWPNTYPAAPQQVVLAPPSVPESLDATMARMQARVAWLEKELSMHESWKAELATLKDLIRAWTHPTVALPPNGADPKETP